VPNENFSKLQKQIRKCPCCGELALMEKTGIRCKYCGLFLPFVYQLKRTNPEKLVSLWNRRDGEKKRFVFGDGPDMDAFTEPSLEHEED